MTTTGTGVPVAPGLIQETAFSREQIDPEGGAVEKVRGQTAVIDAAVNREWRRRAEQAMRTLIQTTPRFTADDIAVMAGLPPSRNAMGALFAAASRAGDIKAVGHSTAKRKARHAGGLMVWARRRP